MLVRNRVSGKKQGKKLRSFYFFFCNGDLESKFLQLQIHKGTTLDTCLTISKIITLQRGGVKIFWVGKVSGMNSKKFATF